MKKLLPIFGFLLIALFILIVVARVTGLIQLYSIPTPSNEPTLKQGSLVLATSLKKYKSLDFICFQKQNSIYTKRLCGTEGDKIEIKKSVLYINGKNIDKELRLMHNYCIKKIVYDSLVDLGQAYSPPIFDLQEKGVIASIVDSVAHHISEVDLDCGSMTASDYPMIKKTFGHDWTPNNFGPIVVPKDSVFVLGDNRDNCLDSRFFGFVPKSAIKQTVILN